MPVHTASKSLPLADWTVAAVQLTPSLDHQAPRLAARSLARGIEGDKARPECRQRPRPGRPAGPSKGTESHEEQSDVMSTTGPSSLATTAPADEPAIIDSRTRAITAPGIAPLRQAWPSLREPQGPIAGRILAGDEDTAAAGRPTDHERVVGRVVEPEGRRGELRPGPAVRGRSTLRAARLEFGPGNRDIAARPGHHHGDLGCTRELPEGESSPGTSRPPSRWAGRSPSGSVGLADGAGAEGGGPRRRARERRDAGARRDHGHADRPVPPGQGDGHDDHDDDHGRRREELARAREQEVEGHPPPGGGRLGGHAAVTLARSSLGARWPSKRSWSRRRSRASSSESSIGGLQVGSQGAQCVVEPGLDRAQRDVQAVGDLIEAEVLPEPQEDDDPMFQIEPVECRVEVRVRRTRADSAGSCPPASPRQAACRAIARTCRRCRPRSRSRQPFTRIRPNQAPNSIRVAERSPARRQAVRQASCTASSASLSSPRIARASE